MPVNVSDLGVDFYAITGHKLYGPNATGALYATRARQGEMRPF
ncbi:MAG: aminotransferase class V-fold PLP-dependent enzyme, partial [Pseudomonadota bacterium]